MSTTSNRTDMGGKVVIVTGGTAGIGRGIAERFLEAGAQVVVCGRNEPEGLPEAGGRKAAWEEANVRDLEQVNRLVGRTVERFGRLDVLVNNAGGAPPADAATVSPRFTAAIIDLNLTAPINVAQRANAVMQDQADGGLILNIASISGTRPSPGTAAYGAAKAGLLNVTASLAMEWAPKVRVNALVVGLVLTEKAALHYGLGEALDAVHASVPLGRMALPQDIGDACLLLASPLAAHITGASLEVHGGGERPSPRGQTPSLHT